jgi:hypothetical protein
MFLILTLSLVAACGGATTEASNDGGGGGSSEAPASSDVGSGGGGGGTGEGSISYGLSGDVDKSGDLPFLYVEGGLSQFVEGGWVAYVYSDSDPNVVIQINSNPASNIVNYGDGEFLVVGTEESSCTFDYSTNDESGLVGTIDCPATTSSNVNTGALLKVGFHATVNAHP